MNRVTVAIAIALLAGPAAGTAFSNDASCEVPKDCLAGGTSTCLLMTEAGPGAGSSASVAERRAAGVVVRSADADGRFAVRVVSGYFRPGADVSIFTPGGDVVARGRVHSVFDDELYVDIAGNDPVPVGFVVLMNYTTSEARRYIASSQGDLKGATADARAEARQRQQQIAADFRNESTNREQWQREVEKLKLQLRYYDDYYSYPIGYPRYY